MSYDIYEFEKLIDNNNSNYIKSDIILISTRWEESNTEKNFKRIDSMIKKIKKDKKELILLSNFPEFDYSEEKFKYRKIELTNYKKKLVSLKTSNISNEEDFFLKRKYYLDYKNNNRLLEINKKLDIISKKHNIKYFDMVNLTCDTSSELCNYRLDRVKDEIFRDYGRYSFNGLNYIGEQFYKSKILF